MWCEFEKEKWKALRERIAAELRLICQRPPQVRLLSPAFEGARPRAPKFPPIFCGHGHTARFQLCLQELLGRVVDGEINAHVSNFRSIIVDGSAGQDALMVKFGGGEVHNIASRPDGRKRP